MKKNTLLCAIVLAITSLVAVNAAETPVATTSPILSVSSTTGYESQYVFRGQKIADGIVTQDINLEISKYFNFDVFGVWNMTSTNKTFSEVDLTGAFTIPLENSVWKTGATVYIYPPAKATAGDTEYTTEVFTSLSYKAFLNPTIRAGYDLNLKQISVEGNISETLEVPFIKGLSLRPTIAIGYAATRDALPNSPLNVKDDFKYATGAVDLLYTYKAVSFAAGVRQNFLKTNGVDGYTRNQWYGASVAFSF